jgi:ABC-type bacteriocin/lantibiotic exporter with double-glycine peptidase domain
MDPVSPANSPGATSPGPPDPSQLVRTLEQLCRLVGIAIDPHLIRDAAARALRSFPGNDPSHRMEQVIAAGAECALRISLVRLTLSDVVWLARPDSPIIAAPPDRDWVVMARRGLFHIRVANTDGRPGQHAVRREALARQLGLSGSDVPAEFAIVHHELPVDALNGRDPRMTGTSAADHGDHGNHAGNGGQGGHGGHGGSSGHAGAHGRSGGHPSPVRRLVGLMRAEMPDIWTIVLFSAITGILYLAVPLTVDAVVNNIAFGGQQQVFVQALLILSFALLAFLGLLAIIRAVQHYLAEIIQRRLFVRLTADLAFRLPRVSASSLDHTHAPELVNRFFDVITVQKSASALLLDGVNIVLAAVIGMVVLGFYHPSLLAFDLILMGLVCFVVFGLGRNAVRTSIRESICKYDVAGWLEQIAHFPNLFKGPGGSQFALDRADLLSRRYLDSRTAHFRVLIRQICGLLALQALASSALLSVGGFLVLAGELTLGQLVASELIVTAVVASVAKLGKHLEAWYDLMAGVEKLGHLVDLPIERSTGETPHHPPTAAEISVSNLSFQYGAHHPLFSNLSFHLPSTARAAIVAPFGGGASTFLDLLYGLRPPTDGHIQIDGIDVRQWSLESLRKDVALVRHHDIVAGSVLDNVRLGRLHISLDEVRDALRDVGILDELLAMPDGLETQLQFSGRPLTSIQRTCLVLARAIIDKPRLLLLDETLDGLDPATFQHLTQMLFDSSRPWTLLVITRDPSVLQLCRPVIRLGDCHLNEPTGPSHS